MPRFVEVDPAAVAQDRGAIRVRNIISGLIASGRADRPASRGGDDAEFVRLPRLRGGWFWVRKDGGEIRRGVSFALAEALAGGFVARMERIGAAGRWP